MNTDNSTPETITIQLTQGQQTVISTIDADLANIGWHAKFCDHYAGGKFSATRKGKKPNGKQTTIYMHRVILSRMLGRELLPAEIVDHRDSDPLNNTRENLRLATPQQNAYNRKTRKESTTGYKGVGFHKKMGKWNASIRRGGKRIHLGYFTTPEAAYEAYCKAAKELHGEFYNPG